MIDKSPLRQELTREELYERLQVQINFLEKQAKLFDEGDPNEGINLALRLRILLHQTFKSKALLFSLGFTNETLFLDTAHPLIPNNLLSSSTLAGLRVGVDNFQYSPHFRNTKYSLLLVSNDRFFNQLCSSAKANYLYVFCRNDLFYINRLENRLQKITDNISKIEYLRRELNLTKFPPDQEISLEEADLKLIQREADWVYVDRAQWLSFESWWNATVIKDQKNQTFSRKELILHIADTDGGAHVDTGLEPKYYELSRENSMGWYHQSELAQSSPSVEVHFASVRQIVFEVLQSLKRAKVFEKRVSAVS